MAIWAAPNPCCGSYAGYAPGGICNEAACSEQLKDYYCENPKCAGVHEDKNKRFCEICESAYQIGLRDVEKT